MILQMRSTEFFFVVQKWVVEWVLAAPLQPSAAVSMRLFGYDKKESEIRTLPRFHSRVIDAYVFQFNLEQQRLESGFLLTQGVNDRYFTNISLDDAIYGAPEKHADYSFLRLTYSEYGRSMTSSSSSSKDEQQNAPNR